MKALLVVLLFTFVSHQGFAKTIIEVSEPNFTADRIELNRVTNTYVVVNPKYFMNALEAYKIAWDGYIHDYTVTGMQIVCHSKTEVTFLGAVHFFEIM